MSSKGRSSPKDHWPLAKALVEDMKSKGFSVIALIFVLAAIGGIVFLVIKFFHPILEFEKSKDARRKADLIRVQEGLEKFYKTNGRYPFHSSKISNYKIKNFGGEIVEWGTSFPPYFDPLPKDPNDPKKIYVYYSTGQTYYLYASLDEETSKELCNKGKGCISLGNNEIEEKACGETCNYGVSSPNVRP